MGVKYQVFEKVFMHDWNFMHNCISVEGQLSTCLQFPGVLQVNNCEQVCQGMNKFVHDHVWSHGPIRGQTEWQIYTTKKITFSQLRR